MTERDRTFRVLDETTESFLHPMRPKDIPNLSLSGSGLYLTFGKIEVERAAERLVHFFVKQGYWSRFKLHELNCFYAEHRWSINSPFFGLMGAWFDDAGLGSWQEPLGVFIATTENGNYFVTNRFVERCATAQPRPGAAFGNGIQTARQTEVPGP